MDRPSGRLSSVTRVHVVVSGLVAIIGAIVAIIGVSRSDLTLIIGGSATLLIAISALVLSVIAVRAIANPPPLGRLVLIMVVAAIGFVTVTASHLIR